MGLRFQKSFKICKGVNFNLSLKGVGASIGCKGLRSSIHSSGRFTNTIGIPGLRLSYSLTSKIGGKKRRKRFKYYKRKRTKSYNLPTIIASRQYNSLAYENKKKIQELKQQTKLNEVNANKLAVDEYNNKLDVIKSIHKECDEYINWSSLENAEEPFDINSIGLYEQYAINQLEIYQPTFIENIFKGKKIAKIEQFKENIKLAKEQDIESYENWKNLKIIAEKVLKGDIDTYFIVINEMNPLDDLLEFGSDFEFGTDNPECIQVEFVINAENSIPKESLSLTKTGKLSCKNLTKTAYYDLFQDYVCSCCIRIARDMFALLPLKNVVVHAVHNKLDSSTGHNEEITVLSVNFDIETLNSLNFELIDPSDSLCNFEHNMKFLKTTGFKKVDRVF